jgi:hypothetical protein
MKIEEAFYEELRQDYKPRGSTTEPYRFRVGFIPSRSAYIAVSEYPPKFCFEGATKEDAVAKAKRALDFYDKNGLGEIKLDTEPKE